MGRPTATPENTEKLFWAKVHKTDECWVWTAALLDGRYGHFHVRRKGIGAHVYSYELHHGPVPEGYVVRHRCNNPTCVNPAHLIAGTQAENIQDAVAAGRHVHGESHGCAILTEEIVRKIKLEYESKKSRKGMAKKYGVSYYTIWDITMGRSWKHV